MSAEECTDQGCWYEREGFVPCLAQIDGTCILKPGHSSTPSALWFCLGIGLRSQAGEGSAAATSGS